MIQARQGTSQNRNPVTSPPHVHYTSNSSEKLYSEPLTHSSVLFFSSSPAKVLWSSLYVALHLKLTKPALCAPHSLPVCRPDTVERYTLFDRYLFGGSDETAASHSPLRALIRPPHPQQSTHNYFAFFSSVHTCQKQIHAESVSKTPVWYG